MNSAPAVALVVAVYRRVDFLELVLASLERQSFRDFEIVIADDGSGPEMADAVRRWQGRFERPILHAWHDDQGFRKTVIVNRAVTLSTGAHLVFIDGDCVLHHRFVERHFVRRRPRQALSGRRVMLDAELTTRLTAEDVRSGRIEQPSWWWNHAKPHDRRNGIYLPALYGWRGLFTGEYAILGSNFSLSREDFLSVNGYDERILARGMEDVNLRRRLLNSGVATRSISHEALQYHCAHGDRIFPHDAESVARWGGTRETWTPSGIVRGERAVESVR
ncbi:MAG: glycosyltransferase [Candidatus Eiseniibacteriota bacterium]